MLLKVIIFLPMKPQGLWRRRGLLNQDGTMVEQEDQNQGHGLSPFHLPEMPWKVALKFLRSKYRQFENRAFKLFPSPSNQFRLVINWFPTSKGEPSQEESRKIKVCGEGSPSTPSTLRPLSQTGIHPIAVSEQSHCFSLETNIKQTSKSLAGIFKLCEEKKRKVQVCDHMV